MLEISSKQLNITPEIAKSWLETLAYPKQRPISRKHVKMIADSMVKGIFPESTQVKISQSTATGRRYITDGVHRLNAVLDSGVPMRFVITEVTFKSEDEIDQDYYRTDQGRKRRPQDAYRALDVDAATGLTFTQIGQLSGAAEILLRRFCSDNSRVSLDDRLAFVNDWAPTMKHLCTVVSATEQTLVSKIMRTTTLSVALATLRYYEDKHFVDDFWHQVAHDDGLRVGDPRKQLHEWLLASYFDGKGAVGGVSRRKSLYYVVKAWNNSVSKRSVQWFGVRDNEMNLSVPILGTPFTLSPTSMKSKSQSLTAS